MYVHAYICVRAVAMVAAYYSRAAVVTERKKERKSRRDPGLTDL